MEKLTGRRYTLEQKQEAVRLVTSGQKVSAAAKAPGIVEQTLAKWVKVDRSGRLRGLCGEQLSAERMENIRLRAELAGVTMERDIVEKPQRTSRRCSDEVCLDRAEQSALAGMRAVLGVSASDIVSIWRGGRRSSRAAI